MQTKITAILMIGLLIVLTACSPNQEPTIEVTTIQTNSPTNVPLGNVQTTATALTNLFSSTPLAEVEADVLGQGGGESAEMDGALNIEVGQPLGSTNANIVMTGSMSVEAEAQVRAAPVDASTTTEEQAEGVDVDDEPAEAMYFEDYGVNPFFDTAQDNLSTFAMDVDTGSYTLARSYLTEYNQMPPPESIRVEEFINYFPQDYNAPTDGTAFAINMDAAPSPFSDDNQILLRVGVQGRVVAAEDREAALLIFVVDVSGSMSGAERLGLAQEALKILVAELREDDRVGIVIYADQARVVLEPTSASEQQSIIAAIDSLQTEGSTYAEAGLALAYEMAIAHQRENQTTRVVLLSDGVANVGATGPDAILETIRQGVDSGVTLSTVGVGMGNFNDTLMEQLANDGNGNYHYVDNIREARRIFVNNLTSTLQVIGYDARIQVEFNPDVVARYRLIGYENRDIADELFRDDTVDAGEVGAGHTITALYELELLDNVQSGTVATAYLRYEDADSDEVVEINQPFEMDAILSSFEDAPVDFQIIATLAEFSEILRASPFGTSDYDALMIVLEPLVANYPSAAEIHTLIGAAIRLG